VEHILLEEHPALPGYDQDALVREHDYLHADPELLFKHLSEACEHYAALVERVPASALQREGMHEEFGPMTIQQCIEATLDSVPGHLEQLRAAEMIR
jgi:hypothetical protein